MWSYMHGTAILLLMSTLSIASPVGSLTTPISVGETQPRRRTFYNMELEGGGGREGWYTLVPCPLAHHRYCDSCVSAIKLRLV